MKIVLKVCNFSKCIVTAVLCNASPVEFPKTPFPQSTSSFSGWTACACLNFKIKAILTNEILLVLDYINIHLNQHLNILFGFAIKIVPLCLIPSAAASSIGFEYFSEFGKLQYFSAGESFYDKFSCLSGVLKSYSKWYRVSVRV